MTVQVTAYGDISPRTATASSKRFLKRGQAVMVTERFGAFDPQPKNNSTVRKFRRYNSLTPATTPLSEGVTPDGQKLTVTDVTCTLSQIGDYVTITDVIEDTHEDPVLQQATDLCGEQAGETVELMRLGVLKAGTTVFYANGSARTALNSKITANGLKKIYRFLKNNKAMTIKKIVKASANISTEPVGEAYFAIAHTDLLADLESLTGWVPVEKYSQSDKALEGEVGKINNIRFLLSQHVTPWEGGGATITNEDVETTSVSGTTKADVYPILVFGREAYGIVPLQGMNTVKMCVTNMKPSSGDPLGQRGTVGWKMYQGCVILNENWIARYEVCASAL